MWSKRRIMEVYLGIIETGPGIYGVDAAARRYFGKPAAALCSAGSRAARCRSAQSAGMVADPSKPAGAGRAARIQRRMGQLGPLLDCLADRAVPRAASAAALRLARRRTSFAE